MAAIKALQAKIGAAGPHVGGPHMVASLAGAELNPVSRAVSLPWPASNDSGCWETCTSGDAEDRLDDELGSVDTAYSQGSSETAAVLLAKLQRSQSECEAWQRHAERLAKRLTVERWQRSGTAAPDADVSDAGVDVDLRRLHQKHEEVLELGLPDAVASGTNDGGGPSSAAVQAAAAQLLESMHVAGASGGCDDDGGAAAADFKWPGRSAEHLQALLARGAAGGWLVSPDEIRMGALLGSGAFGDTHRARWHGADCAVKQVRVDTDVELAAFLREVECLSGLRHPGIVPFLAAVLEGAGHCWLVSEYMPGGSLETLLHGAKPGAPAPQAVATPVSTQPASAPSAGAAAGGNSWPLSERLERALEVATALAALEACQPPILHRDVKPSNILIDGAGRARLSDFGLARRKPRSEAEGVLTGETGTYLYMAPEVMRHEEYNSAADVWSFGVMLSELISRQKPYSHTFMTPVQIALAVSGHKLRPSVPAYLPAALTTLVMACCEFNAEKRPPFSQVVRDLEVVIADMKKRESSVKRGPSFLKCFSLPANMIKRPS